MSGMDVQGGTLEALQPRRLALVKLVLAGRVFPHLADKLEVRLADRAENRASAGWHFRNWDGKQAEHPGAELKQALLVAYAPQRGDIPEGPQGVFESWERMASLETALVAWSGRLRMVASASL
jgi:hypothetical protein